MNKFSFDISLSRKILEKHPVATWFLDPIGNLAYFNEAMSKIIGISRVDLTNRKSFIEEIYPEIWVERENFLTVYNLAKNTGNFTEFKSLSKKNNDCRQRMYQFTLTPLIDENGFHTGLLGTCQLLSEIPLLEKDHQAQEALKESEARYRRLCEETYDVIVLTSPEGIFLDFTPGLERLLEYKPVELIGTSLLKTPIFDPETAASAIANFTMLLKGNLKQPIDYTVHAKSGKRVIIEVFGSPQVRGSKIVGIDILCKNVTALRDAQAALKASEERYRKLCEDAFDIIALLSIDGLILEISPSVEKILEYTPAELSGKSFLISPVLDHKTSNLIMENVQSLIDSTLHQPIEYPFHTKSGRTVFLEVFASPQVKNGEINALNILARDVTEQHETRDRQQALLEKTLQISDLKSNLLTTAAHELKTPLTSIYGWAELLLDTKKSGKNIDNIYDLDTFESLYSNANRLKNLINDFLDVGRIESGHLEINRQEVNFQKILDNSIHAIQDQVLKKGIKIDIPNHTFPPLFVDPQRFEQVVINILSNAVKYSPENTTVTILCTTKEQFDQKVFEINIIDQGFGFTQEELAEAMQPFGKAYTKQLQKRVVKGTGVGLFISKGIVEQHGGELLIFSSGENLGSKVRVRLPLSL